MVIDVTLLLSADVVVAGLCRKFKFRRFRISLNIKFICIYEYFSAGRNGIFADVYGMKFDKVRGNWRINIVRIL